MFHRAVLLIGYFKQIKKELMVVILDISIFTNYVTNEHNKYTLSDKFFKS